MRLIIKIRIIKQSVTVTILIIPILHNCKFFVRILRPLIVVFGKNIQNTTRTFFNFVFSVLALFKMMVRQ